VKDFSHGFIARLTQLDYARAIAFLAIEEATGTMLGVVRLHASADYDRGEFAALVRSDLKGHGLGWILMQHLIGYARAEGIGIIEGQVLFGNTTMLVMCKELGFTVAPDPNDPQVALVTLLVPIESSANRLS
jgi:acetyltransferase